MRRFESDLSKASVISVELIEVAYQCCRVACIAEQGCQQPAVFIVDAQHGHRVINRAVGIVPRSAIRRESHLAHTVSQIGWSHVLARVFDQFDQLVLKRLCVCAHVGLVLVVQWVRHQRPIVHARYRAGMGVREVEDHSLSLDAGGPLHTLSHPVRRLSSEIIADQV